jgi:hypothetical protein
MGPLKIDADSIYKAAGGVIGSSICIVLFLLINYYIADQLNTATAYGTIIGAIANLFLAFATWNYLGEVRKQVNIMAADAAGSKKKENTKYISDVMTKLVAPLYFNSNDEILFGITTRFQRERGYEPGTKAYFEFWDPIRTNMHLAPPALFFTLERYLNAKDVYWNELDDNFAGNMHNALAESAEGERIVRNFNDARSELSLEISSAYRNLTDILRPPEIH